MRLVITYPSAEVRDMVLATGMTGGVETSYAQLEERLLHAAWPARSLTGLGADWRPSNQDHASMRLSPDQCNMRVWMRSASWSSKGSSHGQPMSTLTPRRRRAVG